MFGFTLPVGGSLDAKGEEKAGAEKSSKSVSDAPPPKPKVGDGTAPAAVKAVGNDDLVLLLVGLLGLVRSLFCGTHRGKGGFGMVFMVAWLWASGRRIDHVSVVSSHSVCI